MDDDMPDRGSRVKVYGTHDPVAASHLTAMLLDLGIEAMEISRPDVYFGAGGMWFPEAYQVLVPEQQAQARREDIEAAIAEVEDVSSPDPLSLTNEGAEEESE